MSINQDHVYLVLMNYVDADQMVIDHSIVGIYSDLQKAEAAEHEHANRYREFDDVMELGLLPCHPTFEDVYGEVENFTTILKYPLQ